jgi:ABC-type nickel/cobalt efflux system permease component RcnA
MRNLSIKVDGSPVQPVLESTNAVIADGAGNLPILRITATMTLRATSGRLEYEDHNYEGRAGWKEIVIASGYAQLKGPSQGDRDRSNALTAYPPDPMVAPPQDLRAEFEWRLTAPDAVAPIVTAVTTLTDVPNPAQPATSAKASAAAQTPTPALAPGSTLVIRPIPQPASKPALPSSAATAGNAPAGAVIRNDFISRALHSKDIPLNILFAALIVAFGLGAAHALTPGHGKTIVASYLVGARGTMKHAVFLGLMVTATHTITVFALGLATLFLFRFIVPEKITEILGVISGLSIAVIGAGMLWKRLKAQRNRRPHHHNHSHAHAHLHGHDHPHAHDHSHTHEPQGHVHPHPHPHSHAHDHNHDQTFDHGHDHDHAHHHGPGGHTHVPEGEITWASLTTLAVSGGLVPCESALVLLLGAIAIGRIGLGLLLLISFSLGLAGVLMAIGAIVVYAKRALPKRARAGRWTKWTQWTPIASAGLVALLGVVMTGVSLGWLPSRWLVG